LTCHILTLSGQERDEIREYADLPYLYLGSELSNIKQVVRQVSNLCNNDNMQGIHELNTHLNAGYKIGRYDEVAEVLSKALAILYDDIKSKKLTEQLEDNIKKLQSGELNIEVAKKSNEHIGDEQVKEEIINMQLEAQGIPIVIEEGEVTRNSGVKKSKDGIIIHGDLVVNDKLKVCGKSKFNQKVEIENDLKVKDTLTISGKAKFKKDTEFKKNVKIKGDLIEFKGNIVNVACELDIGCNILLKNSDLSVGNILKNGIPFIHNCGTDNTFVGQEAGNFTLSGSHSSGFGTRALQKNTTGIWNTAIGVEALKLNTIGTGNAVMGVFALSSNITGRYNAVIGLNALKENVLGSSNIAVGREALFRSTGNKNIAIGDHAGEALVLGDDNIYIGNCGLDIESNSIRIGATQETCFVQGIHSAAVSDASDLTVLVDSTGKLGTAASSKQFKDNIVDMEAASDDLMDLRPVSFTYKDKKNGNLHYGLIAEEVKKIYPELVACDKAGNSYAVRYHELPAMLLNELQKHHLKIQELENIIKYLLTEITDLKKLSN